MMASFIMEFSNSSEHKRGSVVRVKQLFSLTVGFLLAVVAFVAPASANEGGESDPPVNEAGLCLVTPSRTDVIYHDEKSHMETEEVPGSDAEEEMKQRWSRDIPAVDEESHQETQFSRVIRGQEEKTHDEWHYKQYVPAVEEVSHQEHQFVRENPGQDKQWHKEYLFKRHNPGHEETFTKERKYKQVTENSHKEFKWQKQVRELKQNSHKEWRYQTRTWIPNKKEIKEVQGYDFVSGGTTVVNGQRIAGHWVQSPGWHTIPDVIINIVWGSNGPPDNVLGAGRVSLSVYGGPNVQVNYNAHAVDYSGWSNWGPWSDWSTTNPGGNSDTRNVEVRTVNDPDTYTDWVNAGWTNWSTDSNPPADTDTVRYVDKQTRKVEEEPTVVYYNDGNWTTDKLDSPWVEIDSRKVSNNDFVAPFWEYKTVDGVTADRSKADWFEKSSFDGWTQFESRKVVDQEAIAPFMEWRLADGSATNDESKADWFEESSFDGWTQTNSKTVTTQKPEDGYWLFLTVDDEGNFDTTTDRDEASTFIADNDVDTDVWTEFGRTIITDQEFVPDQTVFALLDDEGNLMESDDVTQAGWFRVDDEIIDHDVWSQLIDEDGEPVERKVVTQKRLPGYTEYYVPGGEPTLELGESNWTTDEPEGWDFVDERKFVVKEAVPAVVTEVKVVDKAAWTEREFVPAVYGPCSTEVPKSENDSIEKLPDTGSNVAGLAGLAALLTMGGATTVVLVRRRMTVEH